MDLDKYLFFCLIYCLDLQYFGSGSVVNYTVLESFRHLWFPPKREESTSVLFRIGYFFLSLSDVYQYPSSVFPPCFSPLIPWIGLVFPFTIIHKTRGIAVTSHMRKLRRLHCGLAAAGCGAVYTEHLTIYLLCGCLCCVIPGFIIRGGGLWRSSQTSRGCWCC